MLPREKSTAWSLKAAGFVGGKGFDKAGTAVSKVFNNPLTRRIPGIGRVLKWTGEKVDGITGWVGNGVNNIASTGAGKLNTTVKDAYASHKEAAKGRHDKTVQIEKLKKEAEKVSKMTEPMKVEIGGSDLDIAGLFFDPDVDPAANDDADSNLVLAA